MKIGNQQIKTFGLIFCALFIILMMTITSLSFVRYCQADRFRAFTRSEYEKKEAELADLKVQIASLQQKKDEFSSLLFEERDVPAFLDMISLLAKNNAVQIAHVRSQRFAQVNVPEDFGNVSASGQIKQARKESAEKNLTDEQKRQQILMLAAMPVSIKVSGEFKNLAQFLDDLRNQRQLVNINTISMKQSRNYPILDCDFVINIYSLKTLEELHGDKGKG